MLDSEWYSRKMGNQPGVEALRAFLKQNIEGYLFEDLATMAGAEPADGGSIGRLGYPMVATACAGIELLGALMDHETQLDPLHTGRHFVWYWKNILYKTDAHRAECADHVYQLVRHGVAHFFLTKGKVAVAKDPNLVHLSWDGEWLVVNALTLWRDLENSYRRDVLVAVNDEMAKRLKTIEDAYTSQAKKLLTRVPLTAPNGAPLGTPITPTLSSSLGTAVVSSSYGSANYKSGPRR